MNLPHLDRATSPAALLLASACLLAGCQASPPRSPAAPEAVRPLPALQDEAIRNQGFLGVMIEPDPATSGARVVSVMPGPLKPAGPEKALLRPGDVILALNGKPVGPDELRATMKATPPGKTVRLAVLEKATGQRRELTVPAGTRADWMGPVGYRRPESTPAPGNAATREASPAPSEFERFLAGQIVQAGIAPSVEKLEAYFAKTQEETGGFHALKIVAEGFHHPRRLPDLARATSESLDAAAADPRLALRAMATTIDVPPPDIAPPIDLSDPRRAIPALALAAARAQASLDRAFVDFAPDQRRELAADIEALLAHQATMEYVSDSPDATRLIRAMRATMRVDFAALLQSAGDLTGVMGPAMSAATAPAATTFPSPCGTTLHGLPLIDPPWALRHAVTGKILAARRIDGRWFVYGGPGPNTYDMSVIDVVIDPGGNDVYSWPEKGPPRTGIQVIVDLAGDDQYLGGASGGPGGARLGVSLVVDRAGNDEYKGGLGSLGAGVLGVGMIVDFAGADRYTGGAWSEGAGFYGCGAILDLGPEGDAYIATHMSQGIGGPRGCGLLLDRAGRDLYRANGPTPSAYETPAVFAGFSQGVGLGIRGYDTGGVGLLLDLAGDDRYEAGEFSQGGAYYWGLGVLHDHSGNDFYYGNRYSQGFGVHQALGALLDDQGDDTYWGMTAASQGFGWDIGMGVLVDREGNDSYQADELSQGSAAMQAIGWLIDLGGVDRFVGKGASVQGMAGQNTYHFKESGCVSFGLLLHAGGGASTYSSGREPGSTRVLGPVTQPPTAEANLLGLFIDTKLKAAEIDRRWGEAKPAR